MTVSQVNVVNFQNSAPAKCLRFSILELATVRLPGEVMLEVQLHFVAQSAAENVVMCANDASNKVLVCASVGCHLVPYEDLPGSLPGQIF